MVMASAGGVNVPAGAGGDGVGNPTAASTSPAECRMPSRRRRFESTQQGSGGDAGGEPSWVRRLRPATSSRFSPSSSSPPSQQGAADVEQEEEGGDPEVQEMELAPLPPAALVGPPPPQLQLQPQPQPAPEAPHQAMWPMAFGSVAMVGRMRTMEDTVSLHPDLCAWAADGSPVHFFAVFDGHGGAHVSALCRDRMHEFVAEEIAREGAAFLRRRQEWLASSSGGAAAEASTSLAAFLGHPPPEPWSERAEEERAWRAALTRAFRRVDAMAALACACGRVTRPRCRCPLSSSSGGNNCNAAAGVGTSAAAAAAAAAAAGGIVGSTAVVALLVRGRIVVANCGDSRAVLCRGPDDGTPPVPLSFDHKPNRPDEMARILAAGGRVVFNNGHRVRGILAMSRAIGDRLLRPEVIAVPEITITDRTEEDQCLILASDGMWDVIENHIACHVARQSLEDGRNQTPNDPAAIAAAATAAAAAAQAAGGVVLGREEESRCEQLASLLGRLALARRSMDNISIIIVDLKHRE